MESKRHFKFEHGVGKIKFSHDGSRLLSISGEQIISYRANGTAEGAPIELQAVFDAAYVNNEQIVASIFSYEREFELVIFDIKTHKIITNIPTGRDITRSVCVDHPHRRIFAGKLNDFAGDIYVYDLDLNQQGQFKTPDLYMPFDLIASHSGNKLTVAGVTLGIWDVSGEPQLISDQCPYESDCTGTPCEVNSADMTPDGRYAVAGFHGAKGICAVVETQSGKVIGWYGPKGDEINYYQTRAVAISPDGKYVAVALLGGKTVGVYNVSDGTISHRYNVWEYGDIAFSPIGNNALALGGENSVTFYKLGR